MYKTININSLDEIPISDSELAELLNKVYVEGGYTSAELAKKLFIPSLVKARGTLFTARNKANAELVGMVIVVPPNSSYKVLAKENECEMHLLGVDPDYRGLGIGKGLVEKLWRIQRGMVGRK